MQDGLVEGPLYRLTLKGHNSIAVGNRLIGSKLVVRRASDLNEASIAQLILELEARDWYQVVVGKASDRREAKNSPYVPAAAQPEYEFNIEITTGMSAPPIGIINKNPIKKEITSNIQNKLEDCVEQSRYVITIIEIKISALNGC